MALEDFVRAMPKAELSVQLEGAIPQSVLLRIIEENNVAATMRPREYKQWLQMLAHPDSENWEVLTKQISTWLQHPDNITRAVYELGVALSKQNVRYAEVGVMPASYMDSGMDFLAFINALNDGADRVARAWRVKMKWVLLIPRDRPRKAEDIARWATSANATRGNVVGMGLVGTDDAQPIGQFAKAFSIASKKNVPTMLQLRPTTDESSWIDAVGNLEPERLVDSLATGAEQEILSLLCEKEIGVIVSPTQLGRLATEGYSVVELLREYSDAAVPLIVGSRLPELTGKTITDEYLALLGDDGATPTDIEQFALNAIRYSFLPEPEKDAFVADFTATYAALRDAHLTEQEAG